jgi:TRAP-type C4-dicarboxylate transport system permease large subunit
MQERILNIVQHILTIIGGILATRGLIDDVLWQTISGSTIALSSSIWSLIIFIKKNKKIKELEEEIERRNPHL